MSAFSHEKTGRKKDFSQFRLANRKVTFLLIYLVLSLSLIDTPLNTKNEIFIGRKVQNTFVQTQGSYFKTKAEAESLPFTHLPLFFPHPKAQLRDDLSSDNLLVLTKTISKHDDFE